jgi:CHRD domain
VVRRFMLAAVVALSAVLFAAPVALAQYDDSYGTDTGSGAAANTSSESSGGGACPAKPEAGSTILNGNMTGPVEVPPGDADGTGQVTVWLKGDKVWFKMTWEGIDKPNLSHIHKAATGKAGAPVVTLFQGTSAKEGCVQATAAVVDGIAANPGEYYVNVHNQAHPKGAIRAQLAKGESATLPFTGDASQRLLWIGSAITVAGMLLVYATRRYGIRVGRHLQTSAGQTSAGASWTGTPYSAGARYEGGRRAAGTTRRATRRVDHTPW